MAESPDSEIRFRIDGGDKETHAEPVDYEDANETLDEAPRSRANLCGEGDIPRDFRHTGARGYAQDGGNFNENGGFLRENTLTMKPEPYDGGEDWEEYLAHFEVCAELGRWRPADKVLTLAAALRGPARTFYISLENNEKRNYVLLTQKLGARFGSTRQQNRWLSRLEMRKRQPGETVAALADDLRQMAQRAYVDLGGRAQEVLALNQLYKNVTPEVKYQCTNQACRTVSEAVEVIERYEAIMGDGSEKKRGSVRMTETEAPEAQAQKNSEASIKDSIEGINRRLSQLESFRPRQAYRSNNFNQGRSGGNRAQTIYQRRDFRCYICDSADHLCRDCPFNMKAKGNSDGRTQTPMNGTSRTSQNASNQGNFRPPLAH